MAFGFPAYHQVVRNIQKEDIPAYVKSLCDDLNWEITHQEGEYIYAKVIGSALTLGERIIFQIRDSQLAIRSECHNPFQFLDFGKNKKNVLQFVEALDASS